jgi:hypothetical protein
LNKNTFKSLVAENKQNEQKILNDFDIENYEVGSLENDINEMIQDIDKNEINLKKLKTLIKMVAMKIISSNTYDELRYYSSLVPLIANSYPETLNKIRPLIK